MEKIKVSLSQMNLMLMAVEHGFRQCEQGRELDAAWASLYEMYEVEKQIQLHGRDAEMMLDSIKRDLSR